MEKFSDSVIVLESEPKEKKVENDMSEKVDHKNLFDFDGLRERIISEIQGESSGDQSEEKGSFRSGFTSDRSYIILLSKKANLFAISVEVAEGIAKTLEYVGMMMKASGGRSKMESTIISIYTKDNSDLVYFELDPESDVLVVAAQDFLETSSALMSAVNWVKSNK